MPKTNKNYKLKKQNSYKKSCKHKSYKNKSIKNYNKKYNSINGGAVNSPKSTKCALFFDNDAKNLKFVNASCPNVICTNVIKIKVEDSGDSYNPSYDKVLDEITKLSVIEKKDFIGYTDYTVYITKEQYIKYDENSGIKTKELKQLNDFLSTDTHNISDIIFDFDRTFTMVEGIHTTSLNTIKPYKDVMQDIKNILNIIMGGIERRLAMKQLLETCLEKEIKITILTNNDLPNTIPTLMPNLIRLILELDSFDSIKEKIKIISTCSEERSFNNKPKKQVLKFNKLNELKICKNAHINTITDVKTKLFATVPSLLSQFHP